MIVFHTFTGLAALVAGLAVFLFAKGGRIHRLLGRVYALALITLCVASFWIQDTTPFVRGLGTFHIMASVTLVTVIAGLLPAMRRPRPTGWRDRHIQYMLWSYVGLVMALNSHFFRAILLWCYEITGSGLGAVAATIVLVWGLPLLVGSLLIPRIRKKHAPQVPMAQLG